MSSLIVVDQPLCCSRGLCGSSPDPALMRFAADVAWLERNGVAVERINPAEDPERFLRQPAVAAEFEARGNACLPIVLCDGGIVSTGHYPERDELASGCIDFAALTVCRNPASSSPAPYRSLQDVAKPTR